MYAFPGDRVVRGGGAAAPRSAEVLDGDHADGRPPYWVRWTDSGEEALLVPATDDTIEHAGPAYRAEYDEDDGVR